MPCIGRLSEASGSLPDHYLPYLPCDDDDGSTCERITDSLSFAYVYTHTHHIRACIIIRSHFYLYLELRFSALTSRAPLCEFALACMCVRIYVCVLHTKPKLAARRRSRVGRRQPGKLQARPYFVLSCCFSTRRKEMSEQTRHATPNLLISIHILWLLISSLLHSLSLPSPCLPCQRPFSPLLTSSRSLPLYLSLNFFSPGLVSFSAILFLSARRFAPSLSLSLPYC